MAGLHAPRPTCRGESGGHDCDLRGRYHELIASQREAVRAGGPVPSRRPPRTKLDKPVKREGEIVRLVASGEELHADDELKAPARELFRGVNEQIREVEASRTSATYDFVCECADGHCFEVVTIMPAEFDGVTAKPGRYVVAHGHERPGAEEVVDRHERYVVVSRPLLAEEAAAASSEGRHGGEEASRGSWIDARPGGEAR